MKTPSHTKQRGVTASVSIHVRDLERMFNSLDPSPFWDRDLDREAARFIEEEFAEKRHAPVWHLHVHAREGAASAQDLQAAIESYYERLAESARRALKEHLRIGQVGLVAGIAVFFACMVARELLQGALTGVPRMLDEGLIVLAWVALWRPAETLAYEWAPLYRKRRLYERLAGIHVFVRSESVSAAPRRPSAAAGLP